MNGNIVTKILAQQRAQQTKKQPVAAQKTTTVYFATKFKK
jgi:hypothetical protein